VVTAMTETKPKRRWFSFSLRTMFLLVTIIGVAVGLTLFVSQWSLVHQRKQFLDQLNADINKSDWQVGSIPSPVKNPDKSLSTFRRLFGDHNYSMITLPERYDQTHVDAAVRLFPEAQVRHWEPVGKVVGNTYWTIPVVKSKE
jgi:hypothetical protein